MKTTPTSGPIDYNICLDEFYILCERSVLDLAKINSLTYKSIYQILSQIYDTSIRKVIPDPNDSTEFFFEKPTELLEGGVVELNEKYKNLWLDQLSVLTFENFYPNAISHLLDKHFFSPSHLKPISLSPPNFPHIFRFVMDLYEH